MNVSLTPQLEAMVRQKVETGLYNNASEVVREALRLMDVRDRRERLKAAIDEGLQEIALGADTLWTPDSLRQVMQEADAEERRNVPPIDEARV